MLLGKLDYYLSASVKDKVGDLLLAVNQSVKHALSWRFYFVLLFFSMFFTTIIFGFMGLADVFLSSGSSETIALKSAAPILLALVLKVIFWDYLMALKSAWLMKAYLSVEVVTKADKAQLVISIFTDLALTAFLTSIFINFGGLLQEHASDVASSEVVRPLSLKLSEFFDEIKFAIMKSVQNAHYFLNGSLAFYICFMLAWLGRDESGITESGRIRTSPFQTISLILTILIVVLLGAFYMADK